MVDQDDIATGHKIYFHDTFRSSEHITPAVTQTGAVSRNLQQLLLASGVQEASFARANYDRPLYNPLYAKLYFKLRLNATDAVTLFAGFRSTLTAPSWGMTETCAGIYIDGKNDPGTVYFYTANGDPGAPNFQATPIADIDMLRWLVFEIDGYKLRWYSLPYTVPYFDKNVLPNLKQGMTRKWSHIYTNGSSIPDDTMHYLYFYIKNHTAFNKTADVQFINYAEVYPD